MFAVCPSTADPAEATLPCSTMMSWMGDANRLFMVGAKATVTDLKRWRSVNKLAMFQVSEEIEMSTPPHKYNNNNNKHNSIKIKSPYCNF